MTEWTPILLPYCLRITGSRWDAEDLAQDTAMKLMEAVRRQPQRPVTKAFVFRIAKNAWIDEQRKRKIQGIPWEETKEEAAADPSLTTRELLEQLAERLPPRLGVILLLMDVFDFTAKETAGYLQMKEAAVQVSLGRARVRLRQLAQEPSPLSRAAGRKTEAPADLDALADAFRRRDPQAILRAYIGLSREGIRLTRLQVQGDRLQFTFRDPDGHWFQVISKKST
ncbi:RNA polymerase sigma-70 factor (ECF subfamily) [Paenibacillus mucilaginosus]|uniref:RNA polymerase sigma factor n=1 Tax=Paenibacillus mucilaginosus TaxID=61624 RepID=UPI003D1A3296